MLEEHLQGEQQQFVIPPLPKYQFKLNTQQKIITQTLVIAFYGPASLFAQSLIITKSPDARINFLKAKQTSLADIYVNEKTNTTFIVFNSQVQKMKEVYFAQFIEQNFTFTKILIFSHEYVNNLQKQSSVSLQHLKTSLWSQTVSCNKYQQGLMGLAADLLVWAEITRVPTCCYVGLFNDYELTRESIVQVFGALIGKSGLEEMSDIGDKIKKYNMKKYSNTIYL